MTEEPDQTVVRCECGGGLFSKAGIVGKVTKRQRWQCRACKKLHIEYPRQVFTTGGPRPPGRRKKVANQVTARQKLPIEQVVDSVMPWHEEQDADDIRQEVVMRMLSKGVKATDGVAIRRLAKVAKRDLRTKDELSLDAPQSRSIPDGRTLGDVIGNKRSAPLRATRHAKRKYGWDRTNRLRVRCAGCGELFECANGKRKRKYCSRDCKAKLPVGIVIRLYSESRLSTVEIAERFQCTPKSVNRLLHKHGVEMRRHTVVEMCKISGCSRPVFKVRHPINGSQYGTLCQFHRKVHLAELALHEHRKSRKIPPERWRLQNI